MKRMTNTKLRHIIYTVIGILCVGAILCAAFGFPKLYCQYSDKKTLNKLNYMDMSVNTYETAYSSFSEKLHAMAHATTSKGSTLQAVQITEPDLETSKKELTDIVNNEFIELYKNNILPKQITVSEKSNSLSMRYTIYETNKNSNFKATSCWKLEYSSSKRTVTVYLDEEYHKIYYMKIQQKKAGTDNIFRKLSEISYYKSATDAADMDEAAMYSSVAGKLTGYQRKCYDWWEGILQYYDLPLYKDTWGQDLDSIMLTGLIEFKDSCLLSIMQNYINTSEGKQYNFVWETGIRIEEMIQF